MSSGYYNDDSSDSSYRKTVALCVAAASLVVLLFLVVLYLNSDSKKPKEAENVKDFSTVKNQDDLMEGAHNFTSDELEFWDENKEKPAVSPEDEEGELTPYSSGETDEGSGTDASDVFSDENKSDSNDQSDLSSDSKNIDKSDTDLEGEGSLSKNHEEDEARISDDEHIAIVGDDGKKKYYEILSTVKKNDYDFDSCLTNLDGRLSYKDSKREAVMGVDLSKYNGNVDFSKLKDAGVKFAMLRLGSRGYGSGTISLDDKFVEYAQNAAVSGIYTGAYFYSSAITEAEAIEEANYIVGAISGFAVKYPVAIDVEKVTGDTSRTEKLNVEERTKIVKAFCDTVKGYGYNPIIYAQRDMLIAGLNMEELDDYDVWLSDTSSPTDYPYRFSIWQYSQEGKIQGIDGNVDLDLCFVKYEEK